MYEGYNGRILFIDLNTKSSKEETLNEDIYRDFLGGQGLGARILYERMKPGVDALGPDNVLGFVVGLLTGTGIHGARYQLVGKSPITQGWNDTNCGGNFAADLKATGYDGVFITGMSSKPVYIYLNNGVVEFKDATHLWGKDTVDTENMMREELQDKRVSVACIGPAGESKSFIASVMHEGCAAARGGLAAVMGSKLLKALAVKGTKKISITDPDKFASLRKDYLKGIRASKDPNLGHIKKYGTCGGFEVYLILGDTPIKNWTLFGEEGFPNYTALNGSSVIRYQTKRHACRSCPVGCKGWVTINEGPYRVNHGAKIEYETLGMLGPNCLVDNLEALEMANDLCNRLGLDTISTGSVIAFAMECYERGIITKKETDGIELEWGNADALVTMVEKIGRRDGFGAVLADGSKFAAEQIGKGSDKFAIHVGGIDLPAHDPRFTIGCGWGFTTEATPGRHTACEAANGFFNGCDIFPYPEIEMPHLDPFDVEANAPIFAICTYIERLYSSAGICQFTYFPGTLPIIELIAAVTGWDFTVAEGLKAGHRIATLRQAFNVREGIDMSAWRLPERIASPQSSGPNAGRKYDFEAMKAKGYEALGWDPKTGKPLKRTYDQLGLIELVGQLD